MIGDDSEDNAQRYTQGNFVVDENMVSYISCAVAVCALIAVLSCALCYILLFLPPISGLIKNKCCYFAP